MEVVATLNNKITLCSDIIAMLLHSRGTLRQYKFVIGIWLSNYNSEKG